MAPTLTTMTTADFTDEHWDQLTGGADDPFGVDAAGEDLTWRSKDVYTVALDGGRMLARAGTVAVTASIGGTDVEVAGLGGVLVAHDRRGEGLARLVVDAAMSRAGGDVGLLWCFDDRAGLYRKLGWQEVGRPVTVEQPGGRYAMRQRAMWLPMSGSLPAGPVHVHSLPF